MFISFLTGFALGVYISVLWRMWGDTPTEVYVGENIGRNPEPSTDMPDDDDVPPVGAERRGPDARSENNDRISDFARAKIALFCGPLLINYSPETYQMAQMMGLPILTNEKGARRIFELAKRFGEVGRKYRMPIIYADRDSSVAMLSGEFIVDPAIIPELMGEPIDD